MKLAEQEAYQKALEKVVKIEHKKMEANYKALAVAKAKFSSKKSVKRTLMTKGRGKPAQPNIMKKGMRKRGRPRKMK